MSYIHINCPEVTRRAIVAGNCLDCKRRSRFASFFQDWYGWRSTCLRCGRSWDDGEWLPLDFVRGARAKSIESAKRRWRKLTAAGIEARSGETPKSGSTRRAKARPEGVAQ